MDNHDNSILTWAVSKHEYKHRTAADEYLYPSKTDYGNNCLYEYKQ